MYPFTSVKDLDIRSTDNFLFPTGSMFFVNQSVFFLACVFSEPLSMGKLSKLRYPIAKPVSRQGVAILGGCLCFKLGGCYQFFVLNCLVAWKNLRDPGKICFSQLHCFFFVAFPILILMLYTRFTS